MSGIIYYIQSPSGKGYIGQTEQPLKTRLNAHQSDGTNCRLLKKAIDKYGWENMKVTVLLECKKEDLDFYERQMVQAYGTFAGDGYGYNCTTGGEAKKEYCESTKQAISTGLKTMSPTKRKGIIKKIYRTNQIKHMKNPDMGSISKTKHGKYMLHVPKTWTSSHKTQLHAFTTYEKANEARVLYYDTCVRDREFPIDPPIGFFDSIETYSNQTNIEKQKETLSKTIRSSSKQGGFDVFKNGITRLTLPSSWYPNSNKPGYIGRFWTKKDAEHARDMYYELFVKDRDTPIEPVDFNPPNRCFDPISRSDFTFTVPPSWLASPDAQKTYTGFKTRQEAQLFMDNFYKIYVEGYDKPLPCVTSSVPNSQMPYNPYFIF